MQLYAFKFSSLKDTPILRYKVSRIPSNQKICRSLENNGESKATQPNNSEERTWRVDSADAARALCEKSKDNLRKASFKL